MQPEGERCKLVGEVNCKCGFDRPSLTEVENDFRFTLTKLFTDHGVYTVFVIRGMIDKGKDVDVQTARLLLNQTEIGLNLGPYIGVQNGKVLGNLLTEHIKFAAEVVKAAQSGSAIGLEVAKADLFINSDYIAEAITKATDSALPIDASRKMWRLHNELVIQMATHRLNGQYKLEQETYDVYFNEILAMVKAIHASLPAKL